MENLYYIFNDKGEATFPSEKEITLMNLFIDNPIFVLDSCICLDILDLYKKGKTDSNSHFKLIQFLEYISKYNIHVNISWGALELSSKKKSESIDLEKFEELFTKLSYMINTSIEEHSQNKFKGPEGISLLGKVSFPNYDTVLSILFQSYCALLKIREIALKGLKKEKAKKNIFEFADWCNKDFNRWLATELKLAMNIFGGLDEYRTMIWLDGKNHSISQKLWGTAWDLTHYRLHCIISTQNPNDEIKSTNYYFVTKDRRLFNLISNLSLVTMLESDKNDIGLPLLHSNMEYPKFKGNYNEIEDYLLKIQLERMRENLSKDLKIDKIKEQILILEKKNNIA